ncbi:hypothetical protein A2973_04070 [Candidatus Gottesmanbacteria bacterium RIFCSPLOWO2_01_FULL_49_10]|uniref:Uncharacterized protein n=1 Tax=Candidatus Gottesmanbacteria bacterium RIFCSPLOWO2_01_FULL_49_10 TaxID=1798396 RepID=A0A1F6B123_9BACT|nr:MAG: hypothetical protein A2973_04070 [Candidatus Gottesmanbacteria bacterium RIFCSPLOWO2_01_FULL_49_10]
MEITNVLSPKSYFKKRRRKSSAEANISRNPIVFRFWDWQGAANVARPSPQSNTQSFIKPLIEKLLIFIIAAPKNLVLALKLQLPVLKWRRK